MNAPLPRSASPRHERGHAHLQLEPDRAHVRGRKHRRFGSWCTSASSPRPATAAVRGRRRSCSASSASGEGAPGGRIILSRRSVLPGGFRSGLSSALGCSIYARTLGSEAELRLRNPARNRRRRNTFNFYPFHVSGFEIDFMPGRLGQGLSRCINQRLWAELRATSRESGMPRPLFRGPRERPPHRCGRTGSRRRTQARDGADQTHGSGRS
jgi:hypothetical protein